MDIGDRTVYLAAVESAKAMDGANPLTVRRLFADAPDDHRRRLEALYARDGKIDCAAIDRWRATRGSNAE
jgi:hypothetical protein